MNFIEEWILEMLIIINLRNYHAIYIKNSKDLDIIEQICHLFCVGVKCGLLLGGKSAWVLARMWKTKNVYRRVMGRPLGRMRRWEDGKYGL
jgi:hypothetical protein